MIVICPQVDLATSTQALPNCSNQVSQCSQPGQLGHAGQVDGDVAESRPGHGAGSERENLLPESGSGRVHEERGRRRHRPRRAHEGRDGDEMGDRAPEHRDTEADERLHEGRAKPFERRNDPEPAREPRAEREYPGRREPPRCDARSMEERREPQQGQDGPALGTEQARPEERALERGARRTRELRRPSFHGAIVSDPTDVRSWENARTRPNPIPV